jgi:hypothetical protein
VKPQKGTKGTERLSNMIKKIALIAVVLLFHYSALAQSPPPKPSPTPPQPVNEDEVVGIDLNLVQVDAVVTDKNGRQVTNLNASDFSIIENGKSYVVDYCTYVSLADSVTKTDPRAGPPSVAELGRTFVFLVDNPRIEVAFSNSNVGGVSSGSFSLFRRAVRGASGSRRSSKRVAAITCSHTRVSLRHMRGHTRLRSG